MEEMKAFGTFEKGVFHRIGDVPPGMRRTRDSYEAVWEHINGRPMEYPKPRYDEPILMKPAHFDWVADPDQPDVSIKRLGTFSERQVEIAMLRVAAGAGARITPRRSTQIGVIISGTGNTAEHELRPQTALSLECDEGALLTAATEVELLLVGLPIFAQARMSGRKEKSASMRMGSAN
jgi:hypothetical protein